MDTRTPEIRDDAEDGPARPATVAGGETAPQDTGPVATAESLRGDALAARLAARPGPAYKRAYLEGLLRSGIGFLRSGNGRSAAYCFDKVEAGLAGLESAASVADPAVEATAGASTAGTPVVATGDLRMPLNQVRTRWREERLIKASFVLEKHGRRLTTLERKVYRESLAKWSKARESGEGAARRADHGLLELRRRLYGRILKAQKARLVRRGAPRFVPVEAQFPGPIGPYNDRQNLEAVLGLLAQGDPAWVEEFLELYQGLAGLKAMIPAGPAGKA